MGGGESAHAARHHVTSTMINATGSLFRSMPIASSITFMTTAGWYHAAIEVT
jgi:hypothetical protein